MIPIRALYLAAAMAVAAIGSTTCSTSPHQPRTNLSTRTRACHGGR